MLEIISKYDSVGKLVKNLELIQNQVNELKFQLDNGVHFIKEQLFEIKK